ncbi:dimethylamine monooxygenase subunit DmmA family protein [Rhodococcus sp. GXMU-t2271]|uniref:dimethylamine monooxygenase subunit DmmA family protein n=1 Tax=Rhodococcus sp. GXMU-t2271 TaxID=3059079 RepID=UPI00352B0ED9
MKNSGFVTGAVPPLDPSGRIHLMFCLGGGADARAAVTAWAAEALAAGRIATVVPDASAAEVARLVREARAGTRVLIAGPRREAMAATAAARAAGLLPCETTTYVTAVDGVPVFCPHCGTTGSVEAGPGDVVACGSCGLDLEIRPHLSGHHGAYLGAVA